MENLRPPTFVVDRPLRLSEQAQRDLEDILLDSIQLFGEAQSGVIRDRLQTGFNQINAFP